MTAKKTDDWVYLTAGDLENLAKNIRQLESLDDVSCNVASIEMFDDAGTHVTIARHKDQYDDEPLCVAVKFA